MAIMEKKMETTIMGSIGFRVWGLESGFAGLQNCRFAGPHNSRFGILELKGLANQELWNSGIMRSWKSGILEFL